MNTRQNQRQNMFLVMEKYLTHHAEKISGLPGADQCLQAFFSALSVSEQYRLRQGEDITGITAQKMEARRHLVQLAADIARKIKAYAHSVNNPVLLAEVNTTENKLTKSSNIQLTVQAGIILTRAGIWSSELAPYGVDEAALAALQSALDSFTVALPKPRMSISAKKQHTASLDQSMRAASKALKDLDLLVEIVRLSDPDFYLGYQSARKLIKTGVRYLALKGMVQEAESGQPVRGAKVLFSPDGDHEAAGTVNEGQILIKKSGPEGRFNLKRIDPGIYDVVVTKIGFQPQRVKAVVAKGEMSVVKIKLMKNTDDTD